MNIAKIAFKSKSKSCYCSLKVEEDEIPHISLLHDIYGIGSKGRQIERLNSTFNC